MRIAIFTGSSPLEKIGGAEYQSYLLAKGLMNNDHEVTFLATNSREAGEQSDEGLEIVKVPDRAHVGWQEHRNLLNQAIQRFSPDLCYVRVFPEISTISGISKRLGIDLVSVSSHVKETSPLLFGYHPLETLGYLRSRKTFLHLSSFSAIRSSIVHVCNTVDLTDRVRKWYPKKWLHTVYNGSQVPSIVAPQSSRDQIIWVNNIRRWKRPEIFIELARRLPKYSFVMVGRTSGRRSYAKTLNKQLADTPPNFTYHGPVPLDEVNTMIAESALLLYTSLPVEGFANSFLQAWMRMVPTVSLSFNLDGILEREGIGRCSSNFDQLVNDVEELMKDEPKRSEMGKRAREYAISNHSSEKMVMDYLDLFTQIKQRTSDIHLGKVAI